MDLTLLRKFQTYFLTKPLKHILQMSLAKGIFPDQLKLAKVTPIFKTGEKFKFTNYRPISVLPCFSKILERIMNNKLYKHLQENNILSRKQFGFQKFLLICPILYKKKLRIYGIKNNNLDWLKSYLWQRK